MILEERILQRKQELEAEQAQKQQEFQARQQQLQGLQQYLGNLAMECERLQACIDELNLLLQPATDGDGQPALEDEKPAADTVTQVTSPAPTGRHARRQ